MPIVTPSFVYPTNMELSQIDQDLLPVLALTNPIFNEFPIREHDSSVLKWEQRDNWLGLMQMRGPEGEYPVIPPAAINDYELTPGRFGEHALVKEKEIEERRGFGQVNQPINLTDIIVERHQQTATRQFNQMSYVLWNLLSTGYYQLIGPNGAVIKQDAIVLQAYDSVANGTTNGSFGYYWDNRANAGPIADFRAIKLLHRGHSVMLDSNATAWMNTATLNFMLSNTNTADMFGRRSQGLETIEGIDQYNRFIAMRDNLPMIKEYDEGYQDNSKVFHPFIPNGKVILIGKRTNGAALGEFSLTRNASNGNSSSPLVKVVNHGLEANQAPPAKIAVYRGFNGGPRVFYPTAIVNMTVGTF